MRAHPHFRLRLAVRREPQEVRDVVGRSPRVVADGIVQAVHALTYLLSLPHTGVLTAAHRNED